MAPITIVSCARSRAHLSPRPQILGSSREVLLIVLFSMPGTMEVLLIFSETRLPSRSS